MIGTLQFTDSRGRLGALQYLNREVIVVFDGIISYSPCIGR